MTKTLIAALTFASLAAAPALAQTADHAVKQHGHAARQAVDQSVDTEAYGYAGNPYADPYAVIVGNRVVGRDPDINIRLQLKRDVPQDN